MDLITLLDVGRAIYIALSALLSCILAWRSSRWIAKFHEPAWLHLSAMFYASCATYIGITQMGKPITILFPLNVFGTMCLFIFIWKVPEMKTQSWREQRGDPPDWDTKFDKL